MMNTWSSREWQLVRRPTGTPTADDVAMVTVELPPVAAGQVIVRNTALSVEPYMWGRMTGESDYTAPFELGATMLGHAVGQVVASEAPEISVGATVLHEAGWREYAVLSADEVRIVDVDGIAETAWLGVLGLTGFTAWAGLHEVAQLRPGDTVLVSAAVGGVGSTVVQLARSAGCTVVASAGSEQKLTYLREVLRVDGAFSHRDPVRAGLDGALAEAEQDGIDVYFDNVGGEQLECAIRRMRDHGRIALCGAVSTYGKRTPGPSNLLLAIWRQLRLEGFLVSAFEDQRAEFEADMLDKLRQGTVHPVETRRYGGITECFDAFLAMLAGADLGKTVVMLS